LAVVAIAASVVFTRGRDITVIPKPDRQKILEDGPSLEALRAAGF
jgi:hypothetical protein